MFLKMENLKEDRTGTGTKSVFRISNEIQSFDDGFPMVTTKKLHLKSIIYELIMVLKRRHKHKILKR